MPPLPQSHVRRRRAAFARRAKGSVLIVALLLSALIAIGLGSFLQLNHTSTRLAQRSYFGTAALNLAETGAEEAVWSFNRGAGGHADAWSGWASQDTSVWKKFTGFDFTRNTTGWVKVYVDTHQPRPGVRPHIVALASVNPPGSAPVTRMLEVTLNRRSFFASGLVARNNIVFNGSNTSVDSWNSNPDGDPATPPIDYSAAVRTDRGTVASTAVVNSSVLVNQANVWGYVATGGGTPQVGTHGTIRGADTPADVAVDPRRISTDFNAEFLPVVAPPDGTLIHPIGATLGTVGTTTRWRTPSLTLNGNQTLTILGDVTLIVTAGSGAQAVSVTGSASIIIPDGSRLTLYAEGDVRIAGNGLANANVQPSTFRLWGTNTSAAGQDIHIAGNGALRGAVYAPHGSVTINGNGDVMGSIVANDITLVGNAAFHYDEALAEMGEGMPFGISQWRELSTEAERSRYSHVFDGW